MKNEIISLGVTDAENKIKAKKEAEKQAEIERENDKNNRKEINNEAVRLLVKSGVSETAAKKCITAIAKKIITNVKIFY